LDREQGDRSMKIRLPTGGTLVAPIDPTQDLPSDCSRAFSLLPLAASYLASTECLLKVLELVGPLADVVKALDHSPQLAASAVRFLKVAAELAPCELVPTASGVVPFVRDLLCVIIRAVNCVAGQVKTTVALMTALAGQLNAAHAAGNADLIKALEAAQEKAETRAAGLFASIEAAQAVLDLASACFQIAGLQVVQLPTSPESADLSSLTQWLASLEGEAASLHVAADALGGCDGP
jgi:hypothetical protein